MASYITNTVCQFWFQQIEWAHSKECLEIFIVSLINILNEKPVIVTVIPVIADGWWACAHIYALTLYYS